MQLKVSPTVEKHRNQNIDYDNVILVVDLIRSVQQSFIQLYTNRFLPRRSGADSFVPNSLFRYKNLQIIKFLQLEYRKKCIKMKMTRTKSNGILLIKFILILILVFNIFGNLILFFVTISLIKGNDAFLKRYENIENKYNDAIHMDGSELGSGESDKNSFDLINSNTIELKHTRQKSE